jgi:hypothetical protein
MGDNGRLSRLRVRCVQQEDGANDVSDAESEKHQCHQTVCAQHPKFSLFLLVLCPVSGRRRFRRRKAYGPFAFGVGGDQMPVAMNDADSVPAARMMKCLGQDRFCRGRGGRGVHDGWRERFVFRRIRKTFTLAHAVDRAAACAVRATNRAGFTPMLMKTSAIE